MNDFVCVHNFFNKSFGLLLIHLPDFSNTCVIALFKSLILLLQFLKLLCEFAVALSELVVL